MPLFCPPASIVTSLFCTCWKRGAVLACPLNGSGKGFRCLVANSVTQFKLWFRLSSVYHLTLTTLFFDTYPLVLKSGVPFVFTFCSLMYYSFLNSFATLFLCQLVRDGILLDSVLGTPSCPVFRPTSSSLPSESRNPAFVWDSSLFWAVWMVYFILWFLSL